MIKLRKANCSNDIEEKSENAQKQFLETKDITLIAMCVALIAVCAQITIPIGTVPFTLQTFAVFITAYLLGAKRGTIAVIAYILLGAVGVPVFTKFNAGFNVLVGPTGGYILGFILLSLVVGLATRYIKTKNEILNMVIAFLSMVIGDTLCFIIGTFMFVELNANGISLGTALELCVIPFIIPDLVKMVVATIFVNRVRAYVKFS